MIPTKKWYQSKIVLFGLVLVVVYGSNWLFGWLSGNVTPEQIKAIQDTQPDMLNIVDRLKNGESVLNVIGSIAGIIIVIVRVWFTSNLIPQSLKKEIS